MTTGQHLLTKGVKLVGESGRTYELTAPLVNRAHTVSHVWLAIDADNDKSPYIIKQAASESERDVRHFRREIHVHDKLTKSPFIRRRVDLIPSRLEAYPPKVVLEPFQNTVWGVRNMRRLTRKEIKHIMKFTLLGLYHVHEQGLVYTDLKMENMLINFFPKEPSDGSKTVAKLGDLGQVIPPSQGRCQAVAYRSPEVYFGKPWSYPADIWSWGIVLCHLLEARAQFDELGMYDDAKMKGTLEEREEIIRRRMFEDFKLYDVPFYSDCQLPPRDPEWTDDDNWVVRLVKKGISEYDVTFLWNVLKADPNERPTIEQIFRHGYLHNDEGDEDNKSDES